jgi:hypothetical protein
VFLHLALLDGDHGDLFLGELDFLALAPLGTLAATTTALARPCLFLILGIRIK